MVVKLRGIVAHLRGPFAAAYPHVLGLTSIGAIAVGVGEWLGWHAGAIAAALPFATFYIAGQALEVMRHIPKE